MASAQSGLGEPSFLALASHYPIKQTYLTAWSSGTGFAGVFGYAWIALFHKLWGLSFTLTTLLANSLVVCWLFLVSIVLIRPAGIQWYSNTPDNNASVDSNPLVTDT